MFKRIFLFMLTNILVMLTISILINVLGIRPYMTSRGIDYTSLMAFCLVWGMAGSVISLMISRWMAKMSMGIKVIDSSNAGQYQWLYNMVEQAAKAAGLPKTPEVGVYESPEVNAFATGPTKSRSLVAFSTGILQRMSRDEIEGVTGHELSHIKSGDMVTMTLLQGVVNAFVMFFARVIGFFAGNAVKEEQRHMVQMLATFVLDIAFSILGSLVVLGFSRHREFKADAGSARIVGREKMIAALKKLQANIGLANEGEPHPSLATMKISGGKSWMQAFSSHPPLAERIAALENFK